MQGIYTYIPETNHIPREHRVAAILVLLFMMPISLVPVSTPLHLYVSTFQSMCAVPNVVIIIILGISIMQGYIPETKPCPYYHHHHHHHRYLLYAGYLHLHS